MAWDIGCVVKPTKFLKNCCQIIVTTGKS